MEQNEITAANRQLSANTGEIILYQPDNSIKLEVRMEEETVWLTQAQMKMLFQNQNRTSASISETFSKRES